MRLVTNCCGATGYDISDLLSYHDGLRTQCRWCRESEPAINELPDHIDGVYTTLEEDCLLEAPEEVDSRDAWYGHYVSEAVAAGMTYEEAIEFVEQQELEIDQALKLLASGYDVDDALALVRAGMSINDVQLMVKARA